MKFIPAVSRDSNQLLTLMPDPSGKLVSWVSDDQGHTWQIAHPLTCGAVCEIVCTLPAGHEGDHRGPVA